ncbi:MAG: 16S rRNA (guanine(527)-N(7))-methyltransferase RsmG [Anaerolineaceae bacterium]|nr:16S rRNA (guanine(527)-N(7))-methyltransferase RsmG [Anaerolineaceae bacterium]
MEKFVKTVRDMLGIQLNLEQIQAFQVYEQELISWNSKFNLTAIRDIEGIRTKHFLDSLTCIKAMEQKHIPQNLIDIGTGAGFPGIPLKILLPGVRLTLVESVHKKAHFCEHIVTKLELKDVQIIPERAEDVGKANIHRQAYDMAVARAVAPMPVLVEYLLPLVRLGGIVIMQKGESAPAEVQISEKVIHLLGGKLRKLIPIVLPGVVDERFLVIVEKVAVTSPVYPRKAGTPSKNPLN